jgi:hypothetical protein
MLAAVAACIALPQVGEAAGRPRPQQQVRTPAVSPALAWRAVKTGPHILYGAIAAIQRNTIYIRRRNGGLLAVNDAAAIAHGDYSAPLFVGKLVSVDGSVVRGTFVASHIFRLNNLTQLPNDR